MIVLDTNVVSELMTPAPHPQVRAWLLACEAERLATTAVTVLEIEYGLQRLPEGKRKAELFERFSVLSGALTILPLDGTAARQAGRFRAAREAQGLPSQASDMMIAGIAACAGADVATRNVRDFAGLAVLRVVDPWAP